jgi:hypothetical protein
MGFVQKENSGAVFVNDDKKAENHADRKGDCNIDGVEYWISGWIKKDKNGKPFMSLAFKRKDKGTKRAPARVEVTDDSDMPW